MVNSREVRPRDVAFLIQREPYPADLRYSIELRNEDDRLLPKTLRNLAGVSSYKDTRQVAVEIEWLLAREAYKSHGVRYFINSIETLSSDDYVIRLQGRCSRAGQPS